MISFLTFRIFEPNLYKFISFGRILPKTCNSQEFTGKERKDQQ